MRKTQLITTPPQNLSREMILPPYKAPISLGLPILPTQHHIRKNRASRIENPATYVPITHSTSVENPLQIRPFLQNKPNLPTAEFSQPLFYKQLTKICTPSATQKTNPKQTQPVAAKPPCRAEMLHEAGLAKSDQTQFQKECLPSPSNPNAGEVSQKCQRASSCRPRLNPFYLFGPVFASAPCFAPVAGSWAAGAAAVRPSAIAIWRTYSLVSYLAVHSTTLPKPPP